MFYLMKEFRFEAMHFLPEHDGKCRNEHGHSWVGHIVVAGPKLHARGPMSGMLIDYSWLSTVMRPVVEAMLDHRNLNVTLPLKSPTSEAIAEWLYQQWAPAFHNFGSIDSVRLVAVVIEETCTSKAIYMEDNNVRELL